MPNKDIVVIDYPLPGDRHYQARLYPPVDVVRPEQGTALYENPPKSTGDIIEHFTHSSLKTDGIPYRQESLRAYQDEKQLWRIRFEVPHEAAANAHQFAAMHQRLMDHEHAGLAMNGVDAMKDIPGVWNPMAGFPVNHNAADGKCKWHLFLPLGMPMVNHRSVTLLHYPPYVAMQTLDYLHNMTLQRWQRLLRAVGLSEKEYVHYESILDVNPIAAPGSGQSEYPNDYFPVMMSSAFFDAPSEGRGYIRSMLEAMLNPPHNENNPYTLPLLVGGSPLYDPQAPAWFRVRFKEQMPTDKDGIPQAEVLQTGLVRLHPDSEKLTPYIIGNHMIAAGVTGACTDNPAKIPDIRKYEAQDLVAAEFLYAYHRKPHIHPDEAKQEACRKWFGADDGSGAPHPADQDCRKLICTLAQMDLFFEATPAPHPKYTWDEAQKRCETLTGGSDDPCSKGCAPQKGNSMSTSSFDFLITRNSNDDNYQVWRFDAAGTELVTELELNAEHNCDPKFDRTHHLICIGDFLLEWGPLSLDDYYPCYPYRLFRFDPESQDPLAGEPVQQGAWPKKKFWHSRADFGNPMGAKKNYDASKELVLVPLDNFVLNLIPTPGRGTFQLWNFDPNPKAPGRSDPLPAPYTPQGAFETIQLGHELLPIEGYVLDRLPETGEYWLWSFDAQSKMPLARPFIQSGRWTDINAEHQLVVIGRYILDWVPADRSYRLWEFDPKCSNPLTGPVKSGTLPAEFSKDTTVLGVQPRIPAPTHCEVKPGTMDFMRSKIKHVVYYMLENRSFDHVCGWLYEQGSEGVHFVGSDKPFQGASTDFFNEREPGSSEKVYLSKYNDGKLDPNQLLELLSQDPYHDNSDVMRQLFNGQPTDYTKRAVPNMGGFVWNNGTVQVMETYTPEQLPVLNGLARHFAVSDEWFCSMPGGTDVNRAFSLTGSALGMLNNFQNGPEYQYWPQAPHRPSIFKLLWSNGITDWKLYHSVEWMEFVFTYHLFLDGQIPSVDANKADFIASIEQFKADALAGKLPAFSFLEPIWIAMSGTSSYHPGGDLVPGERALNEIYQALKSGPNWEETLLVITFDEHGGIYDHVPPPYAENPYPNDEKDGFRFDIMGPRVPTILVSPWIKEQTVFRSESSVAYDATSFLATLAQWFGIPKSRWALGERTKHAPTFEGVFLEESARKCAPDFNPPHDKQFPQSGAAGHDSPLHDLHGLMAPRLLASLLGNKIGAVQAQHLAEDMLKKASSLKALHCMIEDAVKRYADK